MNAVLPAARLRAGNDLPPRGLWLRQLAYIAGERMLREAAGALDRAPLDWAEVTLGGCTVIGEVHAIRLDGPVAKVSTRRGGWDTWFRIDQVTAVRILPG